MNRRTRKHLHPVNPMQPAPADAADAADPIARNLAEKRTALSDAMQDIGHPGLQQRLLARIAEYVGAALLADRAIRPTREAAVRDAREHVREQAREAAQDGVAPAPIRLTPD